MRILYLLLLCPILLLGQPNNDLLFQQDSIKAVELWAAQEAMQAKGDYQKSFELIQQAKAIYKQWDMKERYVASFVALAQLSDEIDYELKRQMADSALWAGGRLLEAGNVVMAGAYRQKGEALMAFGEFDSAIVQLEKAIPIYENHCEWTDMGWSEILLAISQLQIGQYEACSQQLNRTQALIRTHSLDSDLQATTLHIYSGLYDLQADYESSIRLSNQVLSFFSSKPTKTAYDSLQMASSYNNLGTLYDQKGDHERALTSLHQAVRLFEQLKNVEENRITAYYNIGLINKKLSRYEVALEYFEKAEKSIILVPDLPNRSDYLADCYADMGVVYEALGQLPKAIDITQQALMLGGKEKQYVALTVLGYLYLQNGKANRALPLLEKALSSLSKGATKTTAYRARIYKYIGDAYQQLEQPQKALHFFQQSLAINCYDFIDTLDVHCNPSTTIVYQHQYFLECLQAKANLLASEAKHSTDLEAALSTYFTLIHAIDRLRLEFTSSPIWLHWNQNLQPIIEGAIEVAYQLYQSSSDQIDLENVYYLFERSKANLLLNHLIEERDKIHLSIADSIIQKEKSLQLDIAFYKKKLQTPTIDSAQKVLYQQYYTDLHWQLGQLKETIKQQYPHYNHQRIEQPIYAASFMQKKLLSDTTQLISYFYGDQKVYALSITEDRMTIFDLGNTDTIQLAIQSYYKTLTNPVAFLQNTRKSCKEYSSMAYELYRYILSPILKDSQNDQTTRLIILPDGPLNQIPLEALIDERGRGDFKTLSYLFDRFEFQYAFSANLLYQNQQKRFVLPANTRCLALASSYLSSSIADNGLSSRTQSRSLLYTNEEVQQIKRYFSGEFITDTNANKEKFKKEAQAFGILHLAMHGQADFQSPSYGFLQFSPSLELEREQELLYHYEISQLPLSAQLVVLSACETGRGFYAKGEGVFSLARGFMQAGVPSVVMSLWQVNDQSTSELMPLFYKALSEKKSVSTALRQAKQEFLQTASLRFQHPFYWAGFVLLGDAHPIQSDLSNFTILLVGIGLFLLVISLLYCFIIKKSN